MEITQKEPVSITRDLLKNGIGEEGEGRVLDNRG